MSRKKSSICEDTHDTWTATDEATYRPLRNKLMRIEARKRIDRKGRKHPYNPRRRTSTTKEPQK